MPVLRQPQVRVGHDRIVLFSHEDRHITIVAPGGQDEPILLLVKIETNLRTYPFSREEVETLQSSLVNFLNTGYFDMEG